jgi:signal peptidase II
MARKVMSWALMALVLVLVGCDHATKLAAESALASRAPVTVVPGVVNLVYAENHDTAFSLFRGLDSPYKPLVLTLASLAALVAVLAFAWRRRGGSPVERVGIALVAAGALGNVIDRVHRGYVIDFIQLPHWPVFNVADVVIVAGVALLAISAGLARRRAGPPAPS